MCYKVLWSQSSDNHVLLDAVWCLLTISRFFPLGVRLHMFMRFSVIKCRSALMHIQDSQWSPRRFISFLLYGIIWEQHAVIQSHMLTHFFFSYRKLVYPNTKIPSSLKIIPRTCVSLLFLKCATNSRLNSTDISKNSLLHSIFPKCMCISCSNCQSKLKDDPTAFRQI